jgi:sugar O-acyltransferase (sialic acid O-acetyltransferase NeuD family)
MQKVLIAGNSISAEIIFSYIKLDTRYEVIGFTVDANFITEKELFGLQVIPIDQIQSLYPANNSNIKVVMAIGYKNLNRTRENIFFRLKEFGYQIETYIHPDARVYNGGIIGEGSVVLANTVIEPYSKIGVNSVIWANCTIGHHSKVEDHCWIASGTVLAGEANVKNNCFLGVNVTIANQVIIEEGNVIGGSTFITKSTKGNEVYLSRNGEKHRFDSENYMKYFIK